MLRSLSLERFIPRFFYQRLFQYVLNESPSAVFGVHQNGKILMANKTAQKLFPMAPTIEAFAPFFMEEETRKLVTFLQALKNGAQKEDHFKGKYPHTIYTLRTTGFKLIFASSLLYVSIKREIHTLDKWTGSVSEKFTVDIFEEGQDAAAIIHRDGKIIAYNVLFGNLAETAVAIESYIFDYLAPESANELKSLLKTATLEAPPTKAIPLKFKKNEKDVVSGFLKLTKSGLFLIHILKLSDQESLQIQLLQSQKLHAMGELAGGIAHDFNNLLTAMIGFCDLLLMRHSPGEQSFTDIMQIKQNANRAANLVRQLLAFSRQQTLQPRKIDINDILAELKVLLRRLIGTGIDLSIVHGQEIGFVRVDQGQLEQVIINLVVNARDAMPKGGQITIKTGVKTFEKPYHHLSCSIPEGNYVIIEVNDTGTGITQEDLPRIFDPFFSTKEVGTGTGLGLSTVYGILTQMGGYIIVDTELGAGTTFRIYLPQYDLKEDEKLDQLSKESSVKDLTGSGVILLVEDEIAVRKFSVRTLQEKGYEVIEARNGREAYEYIESVQAKGGTIDLLITDVVMPEMDGPELVERVKKLTPNLQVIFMSGYAESTFRHRLSEETHLHFLAKPFNLKDLALKVKELMEAQQAAMRKKGSQATVIKNYRDVS